jgi:hypothetical protein
MPDFCEIPPTALRQEQPFQERLFLKARSGLDAELSLDDPEPWSSTTFLNLGLPWLLSDNVFDTNGQTAEVLQASFSRPSGRMPMASGKIREKSPSRCAISGRRLFRKNRSASRLGRHRPLLV